MHQHCCFAAINTYICNKAERQWDNTSYCNTKLRSAQKAPTSLGRKLTLALHNCFPGLEITVFSLGTQTNAIGLCWELPGICRYIGLEPSVERVGIFVNDEV